MLGRILVSYYYAVWLQYPFLLKHLRWL